MELLLKLRGETFYIASLTDWCENNIRIKSFEMPVEYSIYPEYRKSDPHPYNSRPPFGILILNGITAEMFEKTISNKEEVVLYGPRTHHTDGVVGWYTNKYKYVGDKYQRDHDAECDRHGFRDHVLPVNNLDLLVFTKMSQHTNIMESSCYGSYPLCGQSFVFANEKIDFSVDDYELIYVEHRTDENYATKFFKIQHNNVFVGIILFISGHEIDIGTMFGDQLNYVESLRTGSICITNALSAEAVDHLLEISEISVN